MLSEFLRGRVYTLVINIATYELRAQQLESPAAHIELISDPQYLITPQVVFDLMYIWTRSFL